MVRECNIHVLKKIQHKLASWEPKLQHLRMMETNIVCMQSHSNMRIPHTTEGNSKMEKASLTSSHNPSFTTVS
jgi:hypothetical protein